MVQPNKTRKTPKIQRRPKVLIWFPILILLIFILVSCANNPSAIFKNPKFPCPSSDAHKLEISQVGLPKPEEKSVADLKDFCARMKQHFANSNMTVKEAEEFYILLEENNDRSFPNGNRLTFRNGSYGMPGPEPRKPFVFERQMMVKKITLEKYEIFYYFIGCGMNYIHEEIYLEQNEIIQAIKIESWSEIYPC